MKSEKRRSSEPSIGHAHFGMASEFRTAAETHVLRKKAPKLKPLDRAMSLAIENYASGNNVSTHLSIPFDHPSHLDSVIVPTPTSLHSVASVSSNPQEFNKKSNIFYIDSSSTSLNSYPDYTYSHTHHLPRKQSNVRRSGTLDVHRGPSAYDIRKTHSFHTQPPSKSSVEDLLLMSRRTNSMRNTSGVGAAPIYSHEFSVASDATLIAPMPIGDVIGGSGAAPTTSNRRNCRMHKSFHERRHDPKREAAIETVKCHSLGDDGTDDDPLGGVKRKHSPQFNSGNSSLENEVFHTRSNSRNKIETEVIDVHDASAAVAVAAATVVTPSMATAVKKVLPATGAGSHKHSSHSLDKPHHSFRRIARATQSFYLNPNQYEELRLQRAMHSATAATATASTSTSSGLTFAGAAKRVHSASMRTKPFRETLAETKKSKSFVSDPFVEYDMSGHRRDSKLFDSGGVSVISGDVAKSPRLSSNLMLADATNFDGSDLAEYDGIMRAYRQNRNSSVVSGGGKKKSSSSKKKKSIDGVTGGETGVNDDGDGETTRKRKRIVCIIVSVFLSLVFASVFVVVFTLTHSNVTHVQDHTRRVYTFAPGPVGNRDSPIHHYNSNTNGNYKMQEFFPHFPPPSPLDFESKTIYLNVTNLNCKCNLAGFVVRTQRVKQNLNSLN